MSNSPKYPNNSVCDLYNLDCPCLPSGIDNCIYEGSFENEGFEEARREGVSKCVFRGKYVEKVMRGDLKPRNWEGEICPQYMNNQEGVCLSDKDYSCPYRFLFNGDLEKEIEGREKVHRCNHNV
jgi:hypothetical protein